MVESALYVVFSVSESQWDSFYSKGSYCNMGKTEKGVKVGTAIVAKNFEPRTAPFPREMTDDELLDYQRWAESANQYPQPYAKS